MTLENQLMGRKLLKKEIPKIFHSELKKESVLRRQAICLVDDLLICERCSFQGEKERWVIGKGDTHFYYCPECIFLGRVESRSSFYSIPEKPRVKRDVLFSWEGELTEGQAKISKKMIQSFKKKREQLVHAVTGAGKTEMLFPLIHMALQKGCRVAVVSPRVDVCLELLPRLQAAFEAEDILLLYGKKAENYRYTSLVVATIHQLLRFDQAFDLIVVDEVDAFPYAGNPFLEHGLKKSLKKKGVFVYLTATPSEDLREKVKRKEMEISYLPRRYHGYQLPVPECHFNYLLNAQLLKGKIPRVLLTILGQQKRACLLFFPNIERMKYCYQLLKKKFPQKKIAYVYAGKKNREEIIMAMRQGRIDWLLTTTILERGVTFSNIDVIVFEADHKSFTTASLVQIAGRVGRKKEHPTGHVYFLHTGKSQGIKESINQIKEMNEKGGFK